MSDKDAFLNRILAEPDDDTVRLVFADWLDENGHPERAAFIRFQIAAAVKGDGGTYWSLHGRVGKPTRFGDLVKHEPWTDFKAADYVRSRLNVGYLQASSSSSAVLWRRGFIEGVLCSGVSLGPQLRRLRRHPVREVRLTNEPYPGVCQKLRPGWGHLYTFRFAANSKELVHNLLSGPGGFPHLLFAEFEFNTLSTRTCPFRLVSPVMRKDGAA